MSLPDFSKLPSDYQHLLHLAKEKHHLDVAPLEELKGGQTGAFLYLVSVSAGDFRQVEHLVLKFDRVNEKTKSTEIERHRLAMTQAPTAFARQNMAKLAYEVEQGGGQLPFFTPLLANPSNISAHLAPRNARAGWRHFSARRTTIS